MFLVSMLQVENKYGDLTILCLEHSIPLHKLWFVEMAVKVKEEISITM